MNPILVFDNEQIVGDDTHATILTESDLYKNLWEAQVGGFLPNEHGEYEEDEQPNLFS
jgi:ATP-binding cassette subfamily B protein